MNKTAKFGSHDEAQFLKKLRTQQTQNFNKSYMNNESFMNVDQLQATKNPSILIKQINNISNVQNTNCSICERLRQICPHRNYMTYEYCHNCNPKEIMQQSQGRYKGDLQQTKKNYFTHVNRNQNNHIHKNQFFHVQKDQLIHGTRNQIINGNINQLTKGYINQLTNENINQLMNGNINQQTNRTINQLINRNKRSSQSANRRLEQVNKIRFVQSNNVYPIRLSSSKSRPISPSMNVNNNTQFYHNNMLNNNIYSNSRLINDKINLGQNKRILRPILNNSVITQEIIFYPIIHNKLVYAEKVTTNPDQNSFNITDPTQHSFHIMNKVNTNRMFNTERMVNNEQMVDQSSFNNISNPQKNIFNRQGNNDKRQIGRSRFMSQYSRRSRIQTQHISDFVASSSQNQIFTPQQLRKLNDQIKRKINQNQISNFDQKQK